MKEQYAVYEKVPSHQGKVNGIILGNYNTKEEAQSAREKYGYNTDNYFVDKIIIRKKEYCSYCGMEGHSLIGCSLQQSGAAISTGILGG